MKLFLTLGLQNGLFCFSFTFKRVALMTFRLLLLSLVISFSLACKNGQSQMPKDPLERTDVFASHLPSDAESLLVIPEIKVFREKAKKVKSNLGDSGMVDQVQKQFQKSFGIDLLDDQSWSKAGLSADSSLGLAMYRDRPMVYMYVENRQKFEQTIIARMEAAFQFKGSTKTTKVGDYQVKYLSDDPAKQIAWLYDGKLVMIAMPSLSKTGALESGGAALVLTDARAVKPEASYKSLKMFPKFKERFVSKFPLVALLPVENYLKNADVQKRIKERPNGKRAEEMIRKYAEYFVAAVDVKGQRISANLFVAGNDQFNTLVKVLTKMEAEGKWDTLVTEKTGLGIRLSVDPMGVYGFAQAAMGEGDVRRFKRKMGKAGDSLGIDIEKDVLTALTGQAGIFFYGIAGSPMALASGDPETIANKVGLMISLSFKSKVALDSLVNKIIQNPGWTVDDVKSESGEILDGLKSIGLPVPAPVRILVYQERLVIAAPALGEQTIYDYLAGKREKDKKIGDVEGFDLGKEFATAKSFNGIYANLHRLKVNPGQILSMVGAGFLIESFQELQLQVAPDDIGLKISFTADMNDESATPDKK